VFPHNQNERGFDVGDYVFKNNRNLNNVATELDLIN
jgi:hypothetical protein